MTTPNTVTMKGEQAIGKRELNVRRWTGAFGLAIVALLLIEFPFRVTLGTPPRLEDTARFTDACDRGLLLLAA